MKKTTWPGNWKVTCHRCGFWFPSSEIKREWTGLLVCEKCWEPRHPQTLIKLKQETQVPPFVSKDNNPDQYVQQCYIDGNSGFSGYAVSGCMTAGNDSVSAAALHDLTTNGHTVV